MGVRYTLVQIRIRDVAYVDSFFLPVMVPVYTNS